MLFQTLRSEDRVRPWLSRPRSALLGTLTLFAAACGGTTDTPQASKAVISPPLQPKATCGAQRDCKTAPPFRAVRRSERGRLVAQVSEGSNFSFASCEDERTIEKWDDSKGWVKLTDDRPPSHEGFEAYIGDALVVNHSNEGCDVRGCNVLRGEVDLGELAEYVKVGSRPLPNAASPSDAQVNVFERRDVTGPVRGSMLVSPGGSCAQPQRVFAVP